MGKGKDLKERPKIAASGGSRKLELNDLKQILIQTDNTPEHPDRKNALKKIIAFMTLGLDTGSVVSQVIIASATKDIVIKKMVYLYLSTNSEAHPETMLLAINTMQKDCNDANPLIRGLALRALSSMSVEPEYLMSVLIKSLGDTHPYVRKTAVAACGKLYARNPQAYLDSALPEKLPNVLRDGDAGVLCNAVRILNETLAEEGGIKINKALAYNFLNRMRDLGEYQQLELLTQVIKYVPGDEEEMYSMMNMMEERLQGSNTAVILAAAKVMLHLTQSHPELQSQVHERIRDPLVTLLTTGPQETIYPVLCHLRLMATVAPEILAKSHKDFFLRYSDPMYIRTIKMDILVLISTDKDPPKKGKPAGEGNVKDIVKELSSFATDFHPETSRAAIRALGRVACKSPPSAMEVGQQFLEYLTSDQDHVRMEAFAEMKNFMRAIVDKKRLEPFLKIMSEKWRKVDDEPSRLSCVWVFGEYGELMEEAPYALEYMLKKFNQERPLLQLELVVSCMKLFFKRPPEMQNILGTALRVASECGNVDVMDRARFYYRLLAKDFKLAAKIVAGKREPISSFHDDESVDVFDKLMEEFNTLSVPFDMPASKFIRTGAVLGMEEEEEEERELEDDEEDEEDETTQEDSSEEEDDEDSGEDEDSEEEEEPTNLPRALGEGDSDEDSEDDEEAAAPAQTAPAPQAAAPQAEAEESDSDSDSSSSSSSSSDDSSDSEEDDSD